MMRIMPRRDEKYKVIPQLVLEVPMAMLEPHERTALRNHGQTLMRLNERGGLAVSEAIEILEDRRWNTVGNCHENEVYLSRLVDTWKKLNAV